MPNFVRVARLSEIPPGKCKSVEVNGTPVALFNVGGVIYATQNNCLHQGGPLGQGVLRGTTVYCPVHGWSYDVTSGACQVAEGMTLAVYPTQVDGDEVRVAIE